METAFRSSLVWLNSLTMVKASNMIWKLESKSSLTTDGNTIKTRASALWKTKL